jgi:hypothetical protein
VPEHQQGRRTPLRGSWGEMIQGVGGLFIPRGAARAEEKQCEKEIEKEVFVKLEAQKYSHEANADIFWHKPTKQHPRTKRAANRRRNKVARLARRKNR